MILACKKKLGKQTKKSGFGSDPPPVWEKFPRKVVFFLRMSLIYLNTWYKVMWTRCIDNTMYISAIVVNVCGCTSSVCQQPSTRRSQSNYTLASHRHTRTLQQQLLYLLKFLLCLRAQIHFCQISTTKLK